MHAATTNPTSGRRISTFLAALLLVATAFLARSQPARADQPGGVQRSSCTGNALRATLGLGSICTPRQLVCPLRATHCRYTVFARVSTFGIADGHVHAKVPSHAQGDTRCIPALFECATPAIVMEVPPGYPGRAWCDTASSVGTNVVLSCGAELDIYGN